ncbi:hypothetical protein B5G43_12615 [Flavonifractor sp. An92]|uniref:DUF3102 domain-containing protein n=1 Tax=Flavonifractor sp. An92 TaxID=1965666 RepID=UPI000B3AE787|nr:DUF3102 domain-containing protein [Flavonifractor sp. An92]OUN05522.1 hypothetical protein B5G43_12615 [Flavonifractor sp. An92]
MGKPDLGRLIAQTMAQPAEGRTIEAITGDILEAKRTGGEAILTIGRCLIEAKDLLPHGEWLPWLTERVEFSPRTAQNFMRLAREWTNTQTLADLGASKALSLLALPPEEREQFMEENNVIDMSARQLEAAIKERDEAKQSAQKLQETLHDVLEDRSDAYQRLEQLTEELDELKARPVEVAVETVVDQEAIDKAKEETRAEMQAKLDKAREAAAKARDRQKQAEASVEILKRSLEEREKAEKKAELSADKDLAQFEVLFQQAQENANKMRGILLKFRAREDPAAAQGAEKALKALAEAIGRCVE